MARPPKPPKPHDKPVQELLTAILEVDRSILAALEALSAKIPPLPPNATGFTLAAFTQPLGDTMVDPGTLVPLPVGTPVPAGSRVVFSVTNDPPGSRISGLTASSDTDPQPAIDSSDPNVNYVLCDPIADQTKDSVITVGDPDGTPTATVTIDWNGGIVTDATGFVIAAFTQPIAVPVPAAARVRRRP